MILDKDAIAWCDFYRRFRLLCDLAARGDPLAISIFGTLLGLAVAKRLGLIT
ncbi:MAG: hypothetical protein QXJ74_05260 [Nitrososphaera sp.]